MTVGWTKEQETDMRGKREKCKNTIRHMVEEKWWNWYNVKEKEKRKVRTTTKR
jgi:hypothetical protein